MAVPILHVCDKFGVGGSSIHGVSRLFAWWFPRYSSRWDVSLCGLKKPEPASSLLERSGIRVTHLGRSPFDPRLLGDLESLARRTRAKLLHVHGYAASDYGRIVARRVGAALVLHEHFADPRMPAYQGLADRALRPWTHRAIGVSRSTVDFLGTKRHVPEDRIRLIWNGAPLDEFRGADAQKRARFRREHSLPSETPVVGIVGRLSEQKGHRYFLEAAALVRKERPDARFLVVGDGELMDEMRRRADATDLRGAVIFAGHQSDVVAALAAIDVLAIASIYEGTPLALFEAMAAGKTIVSTSVDGCGEVLEDGATAVLVPARDARALATALVRVLRDDDFAHRIAAGAAKAAAGYDIAECVRQMEAVYDEALEVAGVSS